MCNLKYGYLIMTSGDTTLTPGATISEAEYELVCAQLCARILAGETNDGCPLPYPEAFLVVIDQ